MSTIVSHDDPKAGSASADLLAQFETALRCIDDDEKQAYRQAMEVAPDLVEIESDRMKFLLCFDSDAKVAAEALVNYWDNRQMIFGDNAFRPLEQTALSSSLGPEAVAILESGSAASLSNKEGRPVLFFNGRGLECEEAAAEPYYRACFAVFQEASENPLSQSDGVVVVVTEPCPVYLYEMLCTSGVPLRVKALHVLIRIHRDEEVEVGDAEKRSVDDVRPKVLPALNESTRGKVQFHMVEEGVGVPHGLGELGITEDMLPTRAVSTGGAAKRKVKKRELPRMSRDVELGGEQSEVPPAEAEQESPKPLSKRRKVQEGVRTELESAMETIDDDKTAYLEAQEIVPHLVRKESDPVVFYRFHDSNASEAAKMLVRYWTKRVKIFGPRAMNPMSQTGEGTMNRNDVVSLNSGIFFNLPPDSSGKPVVFYDHSKVDDMSRDMQRETIPRIALYMLSVAAECALVQKSKGIVLLLPMHNLENFTEHDFSFDHVLSVIPVRVEAVHVFTFSPNNRPAALLTGFAKSILGDHFSGRIYAHSLFSRPDAIRALESFGMSRNNLPKSIGGQWGIERFVEWTELRTRFEVRQGRATTVQTTFLLVLPDSRFGIQWNLPPAASHKGVDKVFDFSGLKQPSKLSEEERIERSRRMNVLHSRRKREREKVEIGVLNEHVDELRVAREHLLGEKHRLQGLLQAAKTQVEMIERGSLEYSSVSAPQLHPPFDGGQNGSSAGPETQKPAVRRLVDRTEPLPPPTHSNSSPYPSQLGGAPSQPVPQQQPQYLFPVGAPPPGSLMMFPQPTSVNQGMRMPQEQHYVQVQGANHHPQQFMGDHSTTIHYAVPAQPAVAVAGQHWQPQMLAGAPPPHQQQPQQQQQQQQQGQPQIVVQVQPYQSMGYVVAPSVVMSNSGPPPVGMTDASGQGYWVVGGGGDQSQGSPSPM